MDKTFWISLLVVTGFAAVHVLGRVLKFLDVIPRSRWLSFAGGVSIAYVFLHIMPELASFRENAGFTTEQHIYLWAMGGLVAFYGLERLIVTHQESGEARGLPGGFYHLHLASFSAYNALVGYLLLHRVEEGGGAGAMVLFGAALGLHFLVNDRALAEDHGDRYHSHGRWILAAAAFAGWGIGWLYSLPEYGVAVLFAVLAGGIILNTIKEELPEKRRSRFGAFAAGAALYAVLLLAAS